MSLATILVLLAIVFGGRAYLAGRIRSPGKNLLILLAPLAGLALWILCRTGSAMSCHFCRSSVWYRAIATT